MFSLTIESNDKKAADFKSGRTSNEVGISTGVDDDASQFVEFRDTATADINHYKSNRNTKTQNEWISEIGRRVDSRFFFNLNNLNGGRHDRTLLESVFGRLR